MKKMFNMLMLKFPIGWRVFTQTFKSKTFSVTSIIYLMSFLIMNFIFFGISTKHGYGLENNFMLFSILNYILLTSYFLFLNLFLISKYYSNDIKFKVMFLEKRKGFSLISIFFNRVIVFKIISTIVFSFILILYSFGIAFPMTDLTRMYYRNYIVGTFVIYLFDLFIMFFMMIFATFSKQILMSVTSTILWILCSSSSVFAGIQTSIDDKFQTEMTIINAKNYSHSVARTMKVVQSKNEYINQVLNDYSEFGKINTPEGAIYGMLNSGIIGDYLNGITISSYTLTVKDKEIISDNELYKHIINASKIHDPIKYDKKIILSEFVDSPFDNNIKSGMSINKGVYLDTSKNSYSDFVNKFRNYTKNNLELELINIVDNIVNTSGFLRRWSEMESIELLQNNNLKNDFDIFTNLDYEINEWSLNTESSIGERIYLSALNWALDWTWNIRTNNHLINNNEAVNLTTTANNAKRKIMLNPWLSIEQIMFSNYHNFNMYSSGNIISHEHMTPLYYSNLPNELLSINTIDNSEVVEMTRNPFFDNTNYVSEGKTEKIYNSSLAIFIIWIIFMLLNSSIFFIFRINFRN